MPSSQAMGTVRNAATSMYFWACIVYVVYASQILAIDYCTDQYSEAHCSSLGWGTVNQQFLAAAIVHLVNALMYLASWYGFLGSYSKGLIFLILLPDFLNIAEACIYLRTVRRRACLLWVRKRAPRVSARDLHGFGTRASACLRSVCFNAPRHARERPLLWLYVEVCRPSSRAWTRSHHGWTDGPSD